MNIAGYIIINSIVVLATILACWKLRRDMKKMEERAFMKQFVPEPKTYEIDVLQDQKLLARILNAKKLYCMDFNKENGLYCTHAKDHRYLGWHTLKPYKHKTHQNGEVKWAMVKKETSNG